MGLILSRFRAKPTTKDLLERFEQEIQTIEDYKWSTIRRQKNIIAMLFFGSGLLYAIVALIFYFYFLPMSSKWQDKCFYSLPLVILPAIAFILQRALQWYYRWVIEGKEDKLKELRKDKRKILDKVMETETYKVAKELLEKYDPAALRDKTAVSPNASMMRTPTNATGLRHRIGTPQNLNNTLQRTPPMSAMNRSQIVTPATNQAPGRPYPPGAQGPTPFRGQQQQQMQQMVPLRAMPRPSIARPILPQDRSVVERLVDYVVGDGPSNRYALICNACKSHNGMALKDEFEYIAFRCCYCGYGNAPRKERPFAPRLMANALPPVVDEPESDTDRSDKAKRSTPVEITDISSPNNRESGTTSNGDDTEESASGALDESAAQKAEDEEKKENEKLSDSLLSEEDECTTKEIAENSAAATAAVAVGDGNAIE